MTNTLYNTRVALTRALSALRVFESQWEDLSYPNGDPRRMIPDAEQPPELIAERSLLERNVVRAAALYSGETPEMASMYADDPHSMHHNYNIECVRFAATLAGWWLPVTGETITDEQIEDLQLSGAISIATSLHALGHGCSVFAGDPARVPTASEVALARGRCAETFNATRRKGAKA